jgi:hypothetical protein
VLTMLTVLTVLTVLTQIPAFISIGNKRQHTLR